MNNTPSMKPQNKKKSADPYLTQKIMSAGPQQLVAYIYDAGIAACAKQDKEKAFLSVQELINSLDFDKGKSVTNTFYHMYRYLQEQLRKDNFEEVKEILTEIRQTWVHAMKVY